jgi:phenylalanyl-tRNA synthetase alpha chain
MSDDRIRSLQDDFEAAAAAVASSIAGGKPSETSLVELQDRFLGRKSGAVTALLKSLGGLGPEERRAIGARLNELKDSIEARLASLTAEASAVSRRQRLENESVDVTLPGRRPARGTRHPLTLVREEMEDIFLSMGYEVYDGPEVDDDYHCFEALNMPPDHPARDMQDTFYLKGRRDLLLRTHTSTGQIRYMLENPHPPGVRIICPGKVFRRDEEDPTHSQMFHQIEGLVVGPDVTLADLKGTFETFLGRLFGPTLPVRFRPSFFPYTEPSVEVDLGCVVCNGAGCRVCKFTGFLELLGSGMVHPAVFEAVNARLGKVVYDPEQVTGFAFGMGIERMSLRRYAIDDIRNLYAGDLRFLEQFGAA